MLGNAISHVLHTGNSFINIEKLEYLVTFVVYMSTFRIIESNFSRRDWRPSNQCLSVATFVRFFSSVKGRNKLASFTYTILKFTIVLELVSITNNHEKKSARSDHET